jgi:hypothetical protein
MTCFGKRSQFVELEIFSFKQLRAVFMDRVQNQTFEASNKMKSVVGFSNKNT